MQVTVSFTCSAEVASAALAAIASIVDNNGELAVSLDMVPSKVAAPKAAPAEVKAEPKAEPKKRGRKPKVEVAPEPEEDEDEDEEADEESDDEADETDEFDYTDVRPAVAEPAKKAKKLTLKDDIIPACRANRSAVPGTLGKFKLNSVQDLKPEQFQDFLDKLAKA